MATTRLAGPVAIPTTPTELYVPSGAVIVTGIHVTSKSHSGASFTLYVPRSMLVAEALEPLTTNGTEFVGLQKVASGKDYDWQGSLPIASGDAIVVVADDTGLSITLVGV